MSNLSTFLAIPDEGDGDGGGQGGDQLAIEDQTEKSAER